MRSIFFLLALIVISQSAFAHTDITVHTAYSMIFIEGDVTLIDNRELSEYCGPTGHVETALNYPWNSGFFLLNYSDFALDEKIIIICRSGNRSNQASEFLDSLGYTNVYDVLGGMNEWLYYYYPTVFCPDGDIDGTADVLDNCPIDYNPSQTDSDLDSIGNACDIDCPDFDSINGVDFLDYTVLADTFNITAEDLPADLDADGTVTIHDLTIFAAYWLSPCAEYPIPDNTP